MAVRLKDVAQRAGVSVKTASNVINDYPHIRPETRARVQAAIDELRYRPNLSARRLKYGRAGFLALALPRLNEPYFAELASVLSAEAARRGHILLLDATEGRPEAEQVVLDGMRSHVIDGLVFSPLAVTAEAIARRTDDIPMVLLGEHVVPTDVDHVGIDSTAAARTVTEHLISLGRSRIAAIGASTSSGTATVRLRGYLQALDAAGLMRDVELERDVPQWDRASGFAAMNALLDLPRPPDAVFCFTDLMASGAIRACLERGIRVPQDVAIAGFDDIQEVQYSTPTVTTVHPDLEHLCREVLDLVEHRIEGGRDPIRHVTIPWTLQIRESTVGIRR